MITVFTTKTCAYCKMVKKYLEMKNVIFQEEDITDDAEKRQELFNKTGLMTVPVITNGSDYINGFNPSLLAKLVA